MGAFLIGREWSGLNCFRPRQDLKAADLCEFAQQGEHGEAGSRAARVNEPTCDQIREEPRRDLKAADLCEFAQQSEPRFIKAYGKVGLFALVF